MPSYKNLAQKCPGSITTLENLIFMLKHFSSFFDWIRIALSRIQAIVIMELKYRPGVYAVGGVSCPQLLQLCEASCDGHLSVDSTTYMLLVYLLTSNQPSNSAAAPNLPSGQQWLSAARLAYRMVVFKRTGARL